MNRPIGGISQPETGPEQTEHSERNTHRKFPDSPYYRVAPVLPFLETPGDISLEPALMAYLNEFDGFNPLYILDRPFSTYSPVQILEQKTDQLSPYEFVRSEIPSWQARLSRIQQYGSSLQMVGGEANGMYVMHHHTRHLHSIDTGLNMEVILRANNFRNEAVRVATLCGLLHDIATPLFGDIAKKEIPGLSEEVNFELYLSRNPDFQQELPHKFGIGVDFLKEWICNRGLLGELLDIADRMAYTARDVAELIGAYKLVLPAAGEKLKEVFADIRDCQEILARDPVLFDLILEISVKSIQGKWRPVFDNPERLVRFLKLRILMHRIIYLNPALWKREMYIGQVLAFLLDCGAITKDTLLFGNTPEKISDEMSRLFKEGELPQDPEGFGTSEDFYSLRLYPGRSEALVMADEQRKPQYVVFVKRIPKVKPGIDYLTGTEIPLYQVLPERARELDLLAASTEQWMVCTANIADKSGPFYDFLKARSRQG